MMETKRRDILVPGEGEHLQWVDLLRSFAICCVILVHVNESVYRNADMAFYAASPLHTEVFTMILQTIGRLGVPIFLFLTGYLLLDRKYDAASCVHFWKRNLLGLFLTTELWIVLYNLFRTVFYKETFRGIDLAKEMLLVQSMHDKVSSFWYLYVILGIYLFLPFVAIALQHFEPKVFHFPMLVVFFFLFVVPVGSLVLAYFGHRTVSAQLSLDFSGGVFGYLVILGYFFKKGLFRKVKSRYLVLLGAGCFVVAAGMQWLAYRNGLAGIFAGNFYNNAFQVGATVCLFLLFSRLRRVPLPRIFNNLAKCAFGIYLLQWPVRIVLMHYISLYSRVGEIALICVLTLGISWGIVWIFSKLPKPVGRLVFYLR